MQEKTKKRIDATAYCVDCARPSWVKRNCCKVTICCKREKPQAIHKSSLPKQTLNALLHSSNIKIQNQLQVNNQLLVWRVKEVHIENTACTGKFSLYAIPSQHHTCMVVGKVCNKDVWVYWTMQIIPWAKGRNGCGSVLWPQTCGIGFAKRLTFCRSYWVLVTLFLWRIPSLLVKGQKVTILWNCAVAGLSWVMWQEKENVLIF